MLKRLTMKTLLLNFFGKILSPKHFLFAVLLISAGSLSAQQTWTTVRAGNWENPQTWGRQNGFPSTRISGTINILHNVDYTSNPPLSVENRGKLNVTNATLNNSSNLNIAAGGTVTGSGATITIGPGVLNMNGVLNLTNSVMEKDGNVVNNTTISLSNACFTLKSGNFNNYGTLSGAGG